MSPFLGAAAALAGRTLRQVVRRPVVLTFSFVQPLLWMAFFGFLFHRFPMGELPRDVTYLDFLTPGIAAMTVLFGASQSGVAWIRDLQTGFLPRLLQTPASHHALLLGKLAGDVLRLLLQAAGVLLLAVLLGARLDVSLPGLLVATVALTLFAAGFAALSSAIALRARRPEVMATFVHLVNMPLLFTSTALVPSKQMPDWLAAFSRYNPLTATVDTLRDALLFDAVPEARALVPLVVVAGLVYWVASRELAGVDRLY